MSTHLYGLYDYILGLGLVLTCKEQWAVFDKLIEKKNPERKVSHLISKGFKLTTDCAEIATLIGGFSSTEEYKRLCSPKPVLKYIKRPFFFLSSLDDPFFGPDCIPIDQCFDHILIGVTKTGGHCGYVQGKYLPTDLWWPKPVFDFLEHFQTKPLEVH